MYVITAPRHQAGRCMVYQKQNYIAETVSSQTFVTKISKILQISLQSSVSKLIAKLNQSVPEF